MPKVNDTTKEAAKRFNRIATRQGQIDDKARSTFSDLLCMVAEHSKDIKFLDGLYTRKEIVSILTSRGVTHLGFSMKVKKLVAEGADPEWFTAKYYDTNEVNVRALMTDVGAYGLDVISADSDLLKVVADVVQDTLTGWKPGAMTALLDKYTNAEGRTKEERRSLTRKLADIRSYAEVATGDGSGTVKATVDGMTTVYDGEEAKKKAKDKVKDLVDDLKKVLKQGKKALHAERNAAAKAKEAAAEEAKALKKTLEGADLIDKTKLKTHLDLSTSMLAVLAKFGVTTPAELELRLTAFANLPHDLQTAAAERPAPEATQPN